MKRTTKRTKRTPMDDVMDILANQPPPPPNPFEAGVGGTVQLRGSWVSTYPFTLMWEATRCSLFIANGCYTRNTPEECVEAAANELSAACKAIHERRNRP